MHDSQETPRACARVSDSDHLTASLGRCAVQQVQHVLIRVRHRRASDTWVGRMDVTAVTISLLSHFGISDWCHWQLGTRIYISIQAGDHLLFTSIHIKVFLCSQLFKAGSLVLIAKAINVDLRDKESQV